MTRYLFLLFFIFPLACQPAAQTNSTRTAGKRSTSNFMTDPKQNSDTANNEDSSADNSDSEQSDKSKNPKEKEHESDYSDESDSDKKHQSSNSQDGSSSSSSHASDEPGHSDSSSQSGSSSSHNEPDNPKCESSQTWNEEHKICEDKQKIVDNSRDLKCTAPKILNEETGVCEDKQTEEGENECTPPKVWNKDTKNCEDPPKVADNQCTAPQVWNKDTKNCEDPPKAVDNQCKAPQVFNEKTNSCEDPSPEEIACTKNGNMWDKTKTTCNKAACNGQFFVYGFLGSQAICKPSTDKDLKPIAQPVGALTAGYHHACAVKKTVDGSSLFCWGDNRFKQVDTEATAFYTIPTKSLLDSTKNPFTDFASLSSPSASTWSSCVIDKKRVYCWGVGDQLGKGIGVLTRGHADNYKLSLGAGNVTKIESSRNWINYFGYKGTTCAIDGGKIYCWGVGDAAGQQARDFLYEPKQIIMTDSSVNFINIAMNVRHGCGLSETGDVWCWGDRFGRGLLGDGIKDGFSPPVKAKFSGKAKSIAVTAYTTCALIVSSESSQELHAECFGDNTHSLLTDASTTAAITASVTLKEVSNPIQLFSGPGNMCYLQDQTRKLYCWGLNDQGQIGSGVINNPAKSPKLVVGDLEDGNVFDMTIGGGYNDKTFMCANTMYTEDVYCWGSPALGRLGNKDDKIYQTQPQKVQFPSPTSSAPPPPQ